MSLKCSSWVLLRSWLLYTETFVVYGYGVGRKPSEDPTVPLTVRLPRSALSVWSERAERKGVSVRDLIQSKLVEAVSRG